MTKHLGNLPYNLTPDDLRLIDINHAADSTLQQELQYLVDFDNDEDITRTLDAALALFLKQTDEADQVDRSQLFKACLYQAIVWEVG